MKYCDSPPEMRARLAQYYSNAFVPSFSSLGMDLCPPSSPFDLLLAGVPAYHASRNIKQKAQLLYFGISICSYSPFCVQAFPSVPME
ncbi:hypothetical protein BDN72DRAFT_262091 [Pluteus cervinus]|uniref:Uncharacterized protein n=1 Tax=Pluteus cervinus TaxID=181527 RepID=A0ACD3AG88_9AGAR|nr:hypothetical protein BDN72DRAFT_262091 [Pluteus cervinus]